MSSPRNDITLYSPSGVLLKAASVRLAMRRLKAMGFEVTLDEFRQRLRKFQGEIKGILIRDEFIAGIGNAYRCRWACWPTPVPAVGAAPWRPMISAALSWMKSRPIASLKP